MPSETVKNCSKLLAAKKQTLAFAESATGGRLAAEFSLTEQAGEILKGGIVCYDACLKEDILQIPHDLIEKFTPESAEVTAALVRRLGKFIEADIHIAITGLTSAGGSETPEKPVGTMFIAAIIHNRLFELREVYSGGAEKIVLQTIDRVADLISEQLGL